MGAGSTRHTSHRCLWGVQLEWEGPTKALELEVGPDGVFAYLLANRTVSARRYTGAEDAPTATIVGLVVSTLVS